MLSLFSTVRIVLVQPQHPGNIGAAARAMKTMGLSQLVLVNPKSFPDALATERAAKADDILINAQVASSFEVAIAPCEFVIGCSARSRKYAWPMIDPKACAEKIIPLLPGCQVAIVFGRESSGLENSELQRCHFHVNIPAVEEYSSLNLAAAVQVVCYELRMAQLQQATETNQVQAVNESDFATSSELAQLDEHLYRALKQIEFIHPKNDKQLMTHLRRMGMRARLEKIEVRLLRGILSRVQLALTRAARGVDHVSF